MEQRQNWLWTFSTETTKAARPRNDIKYWKKKKIKHELSISLKIWRQNKNFQGTNQNPELIHVCGEAAREMLKSALFQVEENVPGGSPDLREATNCTGKKSHVEKGEKGCFLFEAQIIIMSSELYNICRGEIIQHYPQVWDGVNGLELL